MSTQPSQAPSDPVTHETFERAMTQAMDALRDVKAAQSATRDHIEDAVAAGIRRAVADPDLWAAASNAMRVQAQQAAGGWLLGGVKSLATRIAWIVAFVAAAYALGGWGAVVALVKAQGAGPH